MHNQENQFNKYKQRVSYIREPEPVGEEVVNEVPVEKVNFEKEETKFVRVVNCTTVNVRSEPRMVKGNVLFEASNGTILEFLSEHGEWYKVRSVTVFDQSKWSSNLTGYVLKDFVTRVEK